MSPARHKKCVSRHLYLGTLLTDESHSMSATKAGSLELEGVAPA